MEMKVYHGSYAKIETIDFNKCKPYKDFGKGFYVTKIRLQAEYWAERRGRRSGNSGHVTEFEFIETAFEHWDLNVLRVEGPVADDDVTNRIDDYIENRISKADFLEELKFHRSTHQICFCTHRSLQALERIDKKNVQRIDDSMIESLVADYGMTEEQAIDA
jgi:hypothetical protein